MPNNLSTTGQQKKALDSNKIRQGMTLDPESSLLAASNANRQTNPMAPQRFSIEMNADLNGNEADSLRARTEEASQDGSSQETGTLQQKGRAGHPPPLMLDESYGSEDPRPSAGPTKLNRKAEKIHPKFTTGRRYGQQVNPYAAKASKIKQAREMYSALTRGRAGVDTHRDQRTQHASGRRNNPTLSSTAEEDSWPARIQEESEGGVDEIPSCRMSDIAPMQSGGSANVYDSPTLFRTSSEQGQIHSLVESPAIQFPRVQRESEGFEQNDSSEPSELPFTSGQASIPPFQNGTQTEVKNSSGQLKALVGVKSSFTTQFAPPIIVKNLGFDFMDPLHPEEGLRGDLLLKNLSPEEYTFRISTNEPDLFEITPCTVGLLKAWGEKVITFKTTLPASESNFAIAGIEKHKFFCFLEATELPEGCRTFTDAFDYWNAQPFGSLGFVSKDSMKVERASSYQSTTSMDNGNEDSTSRSSQLMKPSTSSTDAGGDGGQGFSITQYFMIIAVAVAVAVAIGILGYSYSSQS